MKIVVLHANLVEIGGAEILLAAQARWLRDAGHEVRVVALRADPARVASLLDGIPFTMAGVPAGLHKFEYMKPDDIPELLERTRPLLSDADAVLAHNFPAAPLAAAMPNSIRRIWYAHEPYRTLYPMVTFPFTAARAAELGWRASDGPTRQYLRRAARRWMRQWLPRGRHAAHEALRAWDQSMVQHLDGIAANSSYTAGLVATATGRRADRVIYPMVSASAPMPPRHGINREAPQILTMSRLGVPKNIDTLVRAMALLRRRHPRACLHVIGDGPEQRPLERLAETLAPGSVRFHGFLRGAEVDAVAAQCDIFALLPADEPFGMVFPEAAARGLLLVGPNHGGPREILDDGALGEVCDPFSPEAAADAIARTLALSDADADRRRIAASASCLARFAPDVIGGQLVELLRG
jgi:glycosyltransferase involved in cell wall biosynthesis